MQNTVNLEFRKIPSLDFLYEISEDGRVVRNVKSKKQLQIKLDTHHSEKGYYAFWTCINLGGVRKVRRHMVHKIVAECWHGPCPAGLQIDHIDRDSTNNHYSNLRYVTRSEQMKNRTLGAHVIQAAKNNCAEWNKKISVGVDLLLDGKVLMSLPSINSAAKLLATAYCLKQEHMRAKLKKRRSHIMDFDVEYRNAETVHRRP